MTAISVSAQDLATATETFNNGAMELQMGNMEAALTNFQSALEMAEALGEQGAEIATNCKGAIPQVMFSIAKGYIKEENFTGAIAQLDATIDAAKKYENADIAAEAAEFIPQVYMQQGNTALKAKDMATALAAYTKVVELEPTNGNALLRLGQVFAATGKVDEAVATFEQAAANGLYAYIFIKFVSVFPKTVRKNDIVICNISHIHNLILQAFLCLLIISLVG